MRLSPIIPVSLVQKDTPNNPHWSEKDSKDGANMSGERDRGIMATEVYGGPYISTEAILKIREKYYSIYPIGSYNP